VKRKAGDTVPDAARLAMQEVDRRAALRAQAYYNEDALDAGEIPAPHTLQWKIARYEQLVLAFKLKNASPEIIEDYESTLFHLYKKEYRRFQKAVRTGKWKL